MKIKTIKKSSVIYTIVLGFGLMAMAISTLFFAPKVFAGTCTTNAILRCGFTTNQEFIDKVRANASGNGQMDLQPIYAHFGLTADKYDRFVATAKDGRIYKDGRVTVDGVNVITNAQTLGRSDSNRSGSVKIGGTTYYIGLPQDRFAVDSLAVKVLLDSNGNAEFVVMNTCGNPAWGTNVVSGAACNLLNSQAVAGRLNTYKFTTNASATGNAKLVKYVYDFGDGSPTVTTTDPNAAVEHTYSSATTKTVTAKVTVYASAPGGTTITSTSAACQKPIQVLAPFYECINLKGALINETDKFSYAFTANMKYGNGATFVGADFDFGDGTKDTGVKAKTGTTVVSNHTYAKAGDYTITAVLKFSVDGQTVSAPACKTPQSVINPYGHCVELGGSILDKDRFNYRFVATMNYGNGATFESADFDFGDGKTATGVKSTDGRTVSVDHTYAAAGNYSIGAALKFNINGKTVTAETCRATVTPTTAPAPECKPGIPVGDVRCNPCPYNPSIPADDVERCVAPTTTLPNTGAGNVIALGSAVLIGGFLWYRHMLFKRHKAAYMAADMGTSPLPLADPLATVAPLAGTPLQPAPPKRSVFRRQRRF